MVHLDSRYAFGRWALHTSERPSSCMSYHGLFAIANCAQLNEACNVYMLVT
jgi:hypothetical protein